ncbi:MULTISPECIES: phage holin family protein [unclassified Facklamia]|uniref:phage holin family protein n=1 Tax=Aerococcaceae TaxID=186827 RepID=UPI0013BC3BFB|nr:MULTISPECIES: phage holin family protein [unclassified Facklamia]MBS4462763.1 phage holin family protein [Aerococcaceae bacterium zg-B36]NEW65313.1 holin [Facklamia sp. 252]NEW68333.1 holin [Facklamia sp. 253]QQD66154.1 phage holin family protein [Aerococcaceae bacterium zg-252]
MEFSSLPMQPIITLFCLMIGYVIKHTPRTDRLNGYIPVFVLIIGCVMGGIIEPSLTGVVYGGFSGLASTGLHQAFKQRIGVE